MSVLSKCRSALHHMPRVVDASFTAGNVIFAVAACHLWLPQLARTSCTPRVELGLPRISFRRRHCVYLSHTFSKKRPGNPLSTLLLSHSAVYHPDPLPTGLPVFCWVLIFTEAGLLGGSASTKINPVSGAEEVNISYCAPRCAQMRVTDPRCSGWIVRCELAFPLNCLLTFSLSIFPPVDRHPALFTLFPSCVLNFLSGVLTIADDFSLSVSAPPFLFQ